MGAISEARINVSIRGPMLGALQDPPEKLPAIIEPLRAFVEKAAAAVRNFDEVADAIDADATLSDVGRADKIKAAALAAMESVSQAEVDRLIELADKDAARMRGMVAGEPPSGPFDTAMAVETLKEVRAKSGMDRLAFLRQHAGDPAFAAAVLNAPPHLSGMTPEELERFRDQVFEARRPELAAAVKVLGKATAAVRQAAANARDLIVQRADLHRSPDGEWAHRYELPGAVTPQQLAAHRAKKAAKLAGPYR